MPYYLFMRIENPVVLIISKGRRNRLWGNLRVRSVKKGGHGELLTGGSITYLLLYLGKDTKKNWFFTSFPSLSQIKSTRLSFYILFFSSFPAPEPLYLLLPTLNYKSERFQLSLYIHCPCCRWRPAVLGIYISLHLQQIIILSIF